MAHLSLALLGPLRIVRVGAVVSEFSYQKVRALLVYLAMEAGQPHTREALVGLLWPDLPDAAARTNLRQALAKLREAIGDDEATPPFLITTRETVQFNPASDYALDAAQFLALLDECQAHRHRALDRCSGCAARLEQASGLYRGDFLSQFSLADSAPFEEWAALKREQLQRRAQEALALLAAYHARRGADELVQRYARRQLELDPWNEEAYRQLMRALARAGQRSAALAEYERCRQALAEGLDAAPSSDTRALYERIRVEEAPSARASVPLRNWPHPATPLIGRQAEMAQLGERLSNTACRLLTLTGPGGIGKSRLALAAAAEHAWAFDHGAAFVPLAPVDAPGYFASALAHAVGVPLAGLADPREQLILALRDREMLIVLDNFEQLLAARAPGEKGREALTWLAELVARLPKAQFMVTSRERLNLQGEWLFDVAGLPYPQAETTPGEAAASGAVQLFVQCARRVRAEFAPADTELTAAARICRLAAGMPLAIELAAAWVRVLGCDEIAGEIEQGLGLLSSSLQDVSERHRSMRAVFDHSWTLLSADEQRAFRSLSVFRGGFEREAAQAVAGVSLPLLSALVDKSLVQRGEARRHDLHPLSAQYARERLREANDEAAICARHAAYYLKLAESAEAGLRGSEQQAWLARLDAEHDNLRTALEWMRESAPDDFVRLSGALWRFWQLRGYLREGRQWLDSALAHSAPTAARARALRGAAALVWRQGDFGLARRLAEDSVALWRTLGDAADYSRAAEYSRRGLAEALAVLGLAVGYPGEHAAARAALEESAGLFRECGDAWGLALALFYLADMWHITKAGDGPMSGGSARELLEESLALFRQTGDRWGIAQPLHGLGYMAYRAGDYAQARRWLEEALQLRREINDRWLTAQTLNILGEVARCEADYHRAEAFYQESLALYQSLDARGRVAMVTCNLGYAAGRRGNKRRAHALFAESLAGYQRLGDQWGEAASLEGLAAVEPDAGRAARLLGKASALREAIQAHLPPADQIEHDRTLADLRARLGEAAFEAAWADGQALTLEQVMRTIIPLERSNLRDV
jgi:predicted ATPase